MGFRYRTPNIHNDIRKSNPIAGIDFDSSQLFILFILIITGFYFVFMANIEWWWKIISVILLVYLGFNLITKYDDIKLNIVHHEYGRTLLRWFRIFLRKILNGNISIDKGADYNYFKK